MNYNFLKMNLNKLYLLSVINWQNLLIYFFIILFCFLSLKEIMSGINFLRQSSKTIQPQQKINNKVTKEQDYQFRPSSLFGIYLPKQDYTTIKKTRLDVNLVGILFSKKSKQSQVLISSGNNEAKLYTVGEELPQGAVIKKITPLEVIILYNGDLERLTLRKNK